MNNTLGRGRSSAGGQQRERCQREVVRGRSAEGGQQREAAEGGSRGRQQREEWEGVRVKTWNPNQRLGKK